MRVLSIIRRADLCRVMLTGKILIALLRAGWSEYELYT